MAKYLLNYNEKYAPQIGSFLQRLEIKADQVVRIPDEELEVIRNEEPIVIKNLMKEKIKSVDAVFYFAGNDLPEDSMMLYQFETAKELNIPVIPIIIPKTEGILPDQLNSLLPVKMAAMNVKMKVWEQLKEFWGGDNWGKYG